MKTQSPLDRLRHHVSGAIVRGEAVPIVEQRAPAVALLPERNALWPETEEGQAAWIRIVSPNAILPGNWPAGPYYRNRGSMVVVRSNRDGYTLAGWER